MMKTKLMLGLMLMLSVLGLHAQETANSRQARKMFDEVSEKVFGAHGATLHYKVNIANLYKTEGTIWYKGKKSRYIYRLHRSPRSLFNPPVDQFIF